MNKYNSWNITTITVLVSIIICAASTASGSGFAVYTQGASALGQGNAATAHADDPTAIFYNPALINKLDGTQIALGTTLIISSRTFDSAQTGKTFETDNDIFYPSTLYITHKLNDKFSAGLGVFSPFGLGTDWGEDWEGRYITTKSELQTFNINPAVSYRVIPGISVAAGMDILLVDATLEKKIKLSPLPDAGQKFQGDGTGIGYNLGVLFDLGKDISFGASYRSDIKVDIDGDATFTLPQGVPPQVAALLQNSPGKTDITFPQQVHAGIHYKGFDPLTLEIGMRWEGWSSFDQLTISLDNGQTSVTKRNWKDVFAYNIGARYRLNDTATMLAGYLYGESPVSDDTFDPSIPDANTHVFSVGTDLDYKKFKVALAYAYQMFESRTKNNTVGDPPPPVPPVTIDRANGTYDSSLHMVGVSLVYKF
ncbi:MAG: long-chain fatty acid transport [Geobacteraceae bacterium]|nr:MAG: long-chain fatty acid transport [Geobacteraceae bacterium]